MKVSLIVMCSLAAAATAAACGEQKNPYAVDPDKKPAKVDIIGVDPDKFDCQTLIPPEEVAPIAGGEVVFVPSSSTMPLGVPQPCHYLLKDRPAPEDLDVNLGRELPAAKSQMWGIAFDCRVTAQDKATRLLKTYAAREDAKEVDIGKRALEHSNAQILFLDDKTPCAVTITGPDESARASLAALVDNKLTLKNCPMRPRAAD